MRRTLRAAAYCLFLALSAVCVLAFLEGLLNVGPVLGRLWRPGKPAEAVTTRFDRELGWVGKPLLDLPDFYGRGLALRTNSRGFRNNGEFDRAPARGKIRIVCSGDSFALGYGVAQDESWCARLENLDNRIETVNMGQGGYGIDQSYLWFRREAPLMDFGMHLFTFTYVDFERMRSKDFFGYAKPSLEAGGGRIDAHGVTAAGSFRVGAFAGRTVTLHQLKIVQALETFYRGSLMRPVTAEVRNLTPAVLEAVKRMNRDKKSRLVCVYLPAPMDLSRTRLDELRLFLKETCRKDGIPLIDLTPEFRRLTPNQRGELFLSALDSPHLGADGHYTAKGNAFVAQKIYDRIKPLLKKWRRLDSNQ